MIMSTEMDELAADENVVFLVLMRKRKRSDEDWVFPEQKTLHKLFDDVRASIPHIGILDTMIRATINQ